VYVAITFLTHTMGLAIFRVAGKFQLPYSVIPIESVLGPRAKRSLRHL
jgi:hypothetical protein